MALVRYEPWSMLDQLRKEMDRAFERTGGEAGSVVL